MSAKRRVRTRATLHGKRVYSPVGIIVSKQVVIQPDSVIVIPLLDGDRILMIKQYRPLAGKTLLELPGGRVVGDEPREHAAKRELYEETGYQAGRIKHLFTFLRAPSFTPQRVHTYLATKLSRKLPESNEWSINLVEISLEDIRKMILSKKIEDGKTICALSYFMLWRGR